MVGHQGMGAATSFIEQQVEAGLLDGGVARCHATTRKGKACQRTPLPGRDYCPSHQHLEQTRDRRRVARPTPTYAHEVGEVRRRSQPLGSHPMSHDADKLIRQLSLVAFLMAERRLLTARDVKSNVEGYSEMSDEAFARRFYSDRAELTALGVPLQSQRDEFTGEELYTLRSENYFLDRLDLDDDELAALQTALYYLEGKFAYAEPFRLALQNLALGRAGFPEPPTETAERVRVSAPDYSPELAGRLAKLESAISKQRTVRFGYWSPRRTRPGERTVNPYALRLDDGNWYVVGHDLDRDTTRTFKVSRIRGDIRFATRRERDFRIPADFDVEQHRVPRPWQIGELVGRARDRRLRRHGLVGRAHALRCRHRRGRRLRDRLRERRPARGLGSAPERTRGAARAGRARRVGAGRARGSRGIPRRRGARHCRSEAHGPPPAAARASDGTRRAGALRRAPGPARAPPRRLR